MLEPAKGKVKLADIKRILLRSLLLAHERTHSSAIFSSGRKGLVFESLAHRLDEPASKSRRVLDSLAPSDDDGPLAIEDLDSAAPARMANETVFFNIVPIDIAKKKVLAVATGAGGRLLAEHIPILVRHAATRGPDGRVEINLDSSADSAASSISLLKLRREEEYNIDDIAPTFNVWTPGAMLWAMDTCQLILKPPLVIYPLI